MDTTLAASGKPFRVRAVAIALAVVLAFALGGWGVARSLVVAGDDPFAAAPELGLPVFDYVQVPPLGQVFRVGDVDVVLMSTVVLEDGGTGLHFVLRREGALPRYVVRLAPADAQAPEDGGSSSMCGASGATGWGECYVRVRAGVGEPVTMILVVDLESQGSFDLRIPNPDGSGV